MRQKILLFILVLVGGLVLLSRLPSVSAPAGAAPVHTTSQGNAHSITGKPSLSASFIDQVLATAHSPMQGDGSLFVQDSQEYGIDDVYTLAIFHHESDYGLTGEAQASRSPGNLRCLDQAHYGNLQPTCRDGYAWFSTWSRGLEALYRLLAGPLYVAGGLTTIEQVIPRYAPPGDQNNDAAYIAAVLEDVSSWRANA